MVNNAEIILVAPCTANFISKISNGVADDLATNVMLASNKPKIVAPAMNTNMWENKAVKNNIRNLLQTEEGERFFQPNLGIGLRTILFEHITEENLIGIQDTILDKFDFWLPFVEVRDIQVLTSDELTSIGANEIRVKILFNIKQDPNTLDSITLSFGSDISEPESSVTSGGGY